MHAPEGYECPFCLLVDGGENEYVGQEHVVERTKETLTFVAPKWWPDNAGAALVIPTAHHENLYELPDELGTPIQSAVRRIAQAMKSAYRCDGISTRQHNEPAGNQDVWHLHVHVFPRYAGDHLYGRHGAWVDKQVMAERAAALRAALVSAEPHPNLR